VCLANQVGREEAAEKPFLEKRLAMREANEKMVLESLAYSPDTLSKNERRMGRKSLRKKPGRYPS
jgi:hypothetical protein